MISSLRKRHRITWLVLAIALPVILAIALISRNPIPADDAPFHPPKPQNPTP